MRMILTPRSAGEPCRRRPCSRLSMRGQRSRPCLRIPFEPGTPGEGVDLMHEDGASTTFRRPSPSYRPILLKWRSADEGRSYKHLVRDHGFRWGYTWTKTFLHGRGLAMPAARRGAHRRKRPRRPMAGMMLHQDASKHRWIPALEAGFDLVITLDDATSEIYSAFLVDEEGTASTFRALLEVFGRRGLPCSLYTDRGSHYFLTPKAGEKPDPRARTQVGRALAQLGIEHIPAYSPEARGRCERAFRTLQDRLC